MKKGLIAVIFFFCLFMSLTNDARAEEKVSGKYHYKVLDESEKTIALTKVDNPGTSVVLPGKIDGYTIVQLGTMKGNTYEIYMSSESKTGRIGIFEKEDAMLVTNLTLPSSLQKIGVQALKDCEKIRQIQLPVSMTHIGSQSFENCVSLQDIVLPKKIKGIATSAFAWCSSLKKVIFQTNKATVGRCAFLTSGNPYVGESKKSQLKKIEMPYTYKGLLKGSAFCGYVGTSFKWRNFTKDNEDFLAGVKTLKEIIFPKTLKKIFIPKNCFYGSEKNIKKFVIPAGVKKVYISQQFSNIAVVTIKGKKTLLEGDYEMGIVHNMISVDKVKCSKKSNAWKKMKTFICPDFTRAKLFKHHYVEMDDYYTKKNVYTKKVVRVAI